MLDEWYPPREIIFSRDQCLWIILYLEIMREGIYPVNPLGSGYDSPQGKKKTKHGAYFETPCQIAAEVDVRLKRTGVDGKLLVAEVMAEYDRYSDEAWIALNYITGWKRKRMSYVDFKKQNKYRENR